MGWGGHKTLMACQFWGLGSGPPEPTWNDPHRSRAHQDSGRCLLLRWRARRSAVTAADRRRIIPADALTPIGLFIAAHSLVILNSPSIRRSIWLRQLTSLARNSIIIGGDPADVRLWGKIIFVVAKTGKPE